MKSNNSYCVDSQYATTFFSDIGKMIQVLLKNDNNRKLLEYCRHGQVRMNRIS